MKIYVGGVNAVGKSTLLKAASEQTCYKYVHGTTGLLDSLGFGKDYEKLRALTQKERDVKYGEFVLSLLAAENDIFLDAHYLALVRGKVDRVTDSWIKEFDMFVLISASFDDIWKRIENDSKTRDRALFPEGMSIEEMKKMLSQYQEQTATEFKRLAELYHKPHVEITNEDNRLKEGAEKLVSLINFDS